MFELGEHGHREVTAKLDAFEDYFNISFGSLKRIQSERSASQHRSPSYKSKLMRAASSKAVDRIPYNVTVLDGKMLIAQRDTFFVIEDYSSFFMEEFLDEEQFVDNMKTKSFASDMLTTVKISPEFHFKGFIDLGNKQSCMMVENIATHQIRFFQPFVAAATGSIEFKQLGLR